MEFDVKVGFTVDAYLWTTVEAETSKEAGDKLAAELKAEGMSHEMFVDGIAEVCWDSSRKPWVESVHD